MLVVVKLLPLSLLISLWFTLPAQADEALDEWTGEVQMLTRTCLTTNRKSGQGFATLRAQGYTEKPLRKRIVYARTLKHRQAMLSRPKVTMNYYLKDPSRWCFFGFLHLKPKSEDGLMQIVGAEAARNGFKRIGVNQRINRFHTVAHEYYAKGPHRLSIVVGRSNGFVSVAIDDAK